MNNSATTCNLTLLNHNNRIEFNIKTISNILRFDPYEDPYYFKVSEKQKIGKWIVHKAESEYIDDESINKKILQYIYEVKDFNKEKLSKLLT